MPELVSLEELQQHVKLGDAAQRLFDGVQHAWRQVNAQEPLLDRQHMQRLWSHISKELLSPQRARRHVPFCVDELLYERVYRDWQTHLWGPTPYWLPAPANSEATRSSRIAQLMTRVRGDYAWEVARTGDPVADFPAFHRLSVRNPEIFWRSALEMLGIHFRKAPRAILESPCDASAPVWLPGASLNIAESCFADRDLDRVAIVGGRESHPGELTTLTLRELRFQSYQCAAALRKAGFEPGDAIAIFCPMNTLSVVAYLGVILAGCAVVSVADSFSATEVAARLRIAGARAIITQDVLLRGGKHLPLYERFLEAVRLEPEAIGGTRAIVACAVGTELSCHIRDNQSVPDMSWHRLLGMVTDMEVHLFEAYAPTGENAASATTNILFSSGTTGEPKAIPWTHVTPIRSAIDGLAHHDIRPGDIVCWPTNLGWMMGPWLVYAALLNSATIALFEGSPLGTEFCSFVEKAHVTMLGIVPSLARVWYRSGVTDAVDWSRIRCFSSSGEASNPETYMWLSSCAGYKPIIEYCGGTEIGGGFLAGSVVQPQAASAFSTPTLGSEIVVIDEMTGEPLGPTLRGLLAGPQEGDGWAGELAVVPPMLGSSTRLLNRDHYKTYFAGMPELKEKSAFEPKATRPPRLLRRHGDEILQLAGGYYRAQGRLDDTMNLGGIKVSSVELERVCMLEYAQNPLVQANKGENGAPLVSEVAAVAVTSAGGGPSALVVFAVLPGGKILDDVERKETVQRIMAGFQHSIKLYLNPLFRVSRVVCVDKLPRTASNKVMRRVLRDQLVSGNVRALADSSAK